jgi:hypothetical protein
LVYGSDATIAQVAQLTNNNTRFLGYGNRISFGIVLDGADLDKAARGTAMDMAIFDQQGCLSPQLIFVEGSTEDADRFSALLGTHLNSLRYLIPARRMSDAAAIREATAMVSFETGATIYADTNLQYTIVRHSSRPAFISQARGFVHVLETHCWRAGIVLLNEFGMGGKLQGASVAARKPECVTNLACELYKNGVCYVSPPGRLQMPPFAWRENGYCALSSLVDDLPQIRTGSE